nr:serine hydrolase domain-containing protein [uncultured Sphingosinicella sp.]
MRKIACAAAGLLMGVGGTAMAQSAAPVGQQVPANVAQLAPAVDALFRRFQEQSHVPGLTWGIVANGQLAYVNHAGVQELKAKRPVNPETLFRIASMSKAFTALAVLKLRDEGKLSLDALAETYVPEMRNWRYPTADAPRIRVRDLLSHTGGFVTDDPWGDRQQPLPEAEFSRMIAAGVPFTRTPGTAMEYSNFGYALLGRIVTNVSGVNYSQYIQREIMRPLGMNSTGYEVRDAPQQRRAIGYRWENGAWAEEPTMPHGAFGAMGGVQTSANDYARWVAFLLSAWPPRGGAEAGPVRRATVRELAQGLNFVQVARRPGASGEGACPQAAAYAMGFRVAQDCDFGLTLAHGGGYPGYGSYLLLLPEYGVGIFALTNRTYAGPTAPVWDTAVALRQGGKLTPRALPVSAALASTYRAAGAMYSAGSLAPGRQLLAMNFLMDRSTENWSREFARLKTDVGECRTDAPITATGALAGRFTWSCDKGEIQGNLLLAPTHTPGIQALRLNPVPRQ